MPTKQKGDKNFEKTFDLVEDSISLSYSIG